MKTTTKWKKASLALVLTLSSFAFAGDRGGNGGSGTETQIAAEQAQLESVALKIKKFFIQNEETMAKEFPEFSPQVLTQSITSAGLSVTNENLVDRHGKNRTCLNFPAEQKIECNYSEVKSLQDDPKALFVLVLHEYLGLMGVEETSPENPRIIDGYSISKRIAPYVTKVSDYDLVIQKIIREDRIRIITNQRSSNYPSLPDLKKNPIVKARNVSNDNAIYSDIVSKYINLEEKIQSGKKLGLEGIQLSEEETRYYRLGKILHQSFTAKGWTPVESIEEANLIFFHQALSCSDYGDGKACVYNTANANCTSDYKAVAQVSTLDGKYSSTWSKEAGQATFMAYNFSNFQKRVLGMCRYQFEAMENAFKEIGGIK